VDFRSALARNLPPRQLGPVRLSYADSCLVLDVVAHGRARALAGGAWWLGLLSGAAALVLLLQPTGEVGLAAPGLVLASAACLGAAAWLERPPGYHRWALVFATEELVLEQRSRPLRPARAERIPFNQVTGLDVEEGPAGRRLVLRYEGDHGEPRTAVLLQRLDARDAAWSTELVDRLRRMFGLTSAGGRPSHPPPSRTHGPAAPPASG